MVQMGYASWAPEEPEVEEAPKDEPATHKDGEGSSGSKCFADPERETFIYPLEQSIPF